MGRKESLTQVFRRPLDGRCFFDEVIRDHLDLGRPEQVRLIFGRRITRRTRSHFQTRVFTRDVAPSLCFPYKRSRIKQYFKEGRALRTETTINDPDGFGVGKRLCNPGLAPRDRPTPTALCGYVPMVAGFTNASLRARVGALLDPEHPESYTRSRMSYDLRRLRLTGIIERTPHSQRYERTPLGRRVALFFSKTQARLVSCNRTSLHVDRRAGSF